MTALMATSAYVPVNILEGSCSLISQHLVGKTFEGFRRGACYVAVDLCLVSHTVTYLRKRCMLHGGMFLTLWCVWGTDTQCKVPNVTRRFTCVYLYVCYSRHLWRWSAAQSSWCYIEVDLCVQGFHNPCWCLRVMWFVVWEYKALWLFSFVMGCL